MSRIIQQIAATEVVRKDGVREQTLFALDTDGALWALEDPTTVRVDERAKWKALPDLPFYSKELK